MKRTSRTPCKLPDSLHHRLNAYVLTASAAGVSLLALADPAQARIVYTPGDVTFGGGYDRGSYQLDLNHDGITDFTFGFGPITSNGFRSGSVLGVGPAASNAVEGGAGAASWASCLQSGALIGPKQSFVSGGGLMAYTKSGRSDRGYWPYRSPGYLGLRFNIHGQTHYGWARLSVLQGNRNFKTALEGYAYETIPNKPIIAGKKRGADDAQPAHASLGAPQVASLGRLAQGASGLTAWPRKELAGSSTK